MEEQDSILDLSRQFLIVSGVEDFNYVIIGAGGIGSNTAYMLACMGAQNIIVFDDDDVEAANIPPAFYGRNDIGQKKVHALSERILEMTGVEIIANPNKYVGQELQQADVVIVTADGLSKRRAIWEAGHERLDWQYWIDARMGGATSSVILLRNKPNMLQYKLDLFEIDQAEYELKMSDALADLENIATKYYSDYLTGEDAQIPCGEKATAFITKGTIQGLIGEALFNILNDRRLPRLQLRDAEDTISMTNWIE